MPICSKRSERDAALHDQEGTPVLRTCGSSSGLHVSHIIANTAARLGMLMAIHTFWCRSVDHTDRQTQDMAQRDTQENDYNLHLQRLQDVLRSIVNQMEEAGSTNNLILPIYASCYTDAHLEGSYAKTSNASQTTTVAK